MDTYEVRRKKMVERQLISRGIRDERVLSAMARVPRHLFVGQDQEDRAYDDSALSIGQGQTISQPYMVAVMTEILCVKPQDRVLEIGTGSGYQAAILAELAKEVYTVERIALLADRARFFFNELGYGTIQMKVDDGTSGWPEFAPFDKILVTASAPEIPESLLAQLAQEGIALAPVGTRYAQELLTIKKRGSLFEKTWSVPCVFVPLIGKYGWSVEE